MLFRSDFLTDTKGNGIINTIFNGYEPYCGDIAYRKLGSLIAFETGESVTYGLFSAQDRGALFIGAGEKVYAGMVIGSSSRAEDIEINVCKKKHLTNTRSSSADEALTLVPPRILSLVLMFRISSDSVVMSPFSFLILLVRILSLCPLVSLAKGLSTPCGWTSPARTTASA